MRDKNSLNDNIFVRILTKIRNFFQGIYKFLNTSLFEVRSINIYVQDIIVFFIGVLVILISVHYLRKSFKHNVKPVKVVVYKTVPPVPVEKWDYIKYFTYDNDLYVPALNSKSDTYYSYTRKLPDPITSATQRSVLNDFNITLRSDDITKSTTLNNFVNISNFDLNNNIEQISSKPFDIKNFIAKHKITYDPPKLNEAPKAPLLHWYCGPYLIVSDAIKYLNRVNQVAQFSGFGDIYTNNQFYYVKVSRELTATEVKVLSRFYHLNCEINLNLDNYHEYDKEADSKVVASKNTNTTNDDAVNGNDLVGIDTQNPNPTTKPTQKPSRKKK